MRDQWVGGFQAGALPFVVCRASHDRCQKPPHNRLYSCMAVSPVVVVKCTREVFQDLSSHPRAYAEDVLVDFAKRVGDSATSCVLAYETADSVSTTVDRFGLYHIVPVTGRQYVIEVISILRILRILPFGVELPSKWARCGRYPVTVPVPEEVPRHTDYPSNRTSVILKTS